MTYSTQYWITRDAKLSVTAVMHLDGGVVGFSYSDNAKTIAEISHGIQFFNSRYRVVESGVAITEWVNVHPQWLLPIHIIRASGIVYYCIGDEPSTHSVLGIIQGSVIHESSTPSNADVVAVLRFDGEINEGSLVLLDANLEVFTLAAVEVRSKPLAVGAFASGAGNGYVSIAMNPLSARCHTPDFLVAALFSKPLAVYSSGGVANQSTVVAEMKRLEVSASTVPAIMDASAYITSMPMGALSASSEYMPVETVVLSKPMDVAAFASGDIYGYVSTALRSARVFSLASIIEPTLDVAGFAELPMMTVSFSIPEAEQPIISVQDGITTVTPAPNNDSVTIIIDDVTIVIEELLPDQWEVIEGSLPDGVTIDSVTGVVDIPPSVAEPDQITAIGSETGKIDSQPITLEVPVVGTVVEVIALASSEYSHNARLDALSVATALIEITETISDLRVSTASASALLSQQGFSLCESVADADVLVIDSSLAQPITSTASAVAETEPFTSSSRLLVSNVIAAVQIDDRSSQDCEVAAIAFAELEQRALQQIESMATAQAESADVIQARSARVESVAVVNTGVEHLRISSPEIISTALAGAEVLQYEPSAIAWVMNTHTAAVSWYSNYQFLDIVQVGNRVLAVGPEGLSELVGGSDNGLPIQARIDFGFKQYEVLDAYSKGRADTKKRIDSFWFGYRASQPLELTVETYGQGLPVYRYEMPDTPADQPRNNRIRPGKKLAARYWRVSVYNSNGGSFRVDDMSADIYELGRRI